MMQLFLIPFFLLLGLPAIIAGFMWQFIASGFAIGREKADEVVDKL